VTTHEQCIKPSGPTLVSETTSQRKLKEGETGTALRDNRPSVAAFQSLNQVANNSSQSDRLAQLQSRANGDKSTNLTKTISKDTPIQRMMFNYTDDGGYDEPALREVDSEIFDRWADLMYAFEIEAQEDSTRLKALLDTIPDDKAEGEQKLFDCISEVLGKISFKEKVTDSGLLNEKMRESGVWKYTVSPASKPDFPKPKSEPNMVTKDGGIFGANTFFMQYDENDTGQEPQFQHIADMVKIASHEKTVLHVSCTATGKVKLEDDLKVRVPGYEPFIDFILVEANQNQWAEDSGEYTQTGDVITPNATGIDGGLIDAAYDAVPRGRGERGGFEQTANWLNRDMFDTGHPLEELGLSVLENQRGPEKSEVATKKSRQVRPSKLYVEGGNMLSGLDSVGNPYLLVGKDTIDINHAISELWTADTIRKQLALEYNIPEKSVAFVEQPGRFHLDMGMVVFSNGHVILNNSELVLEKMTQWIAEDVIFLKTKLQADEVEAMAKGFETIMEFLTAALTERAVLEKIAYQDLMIATETIGLKVSRLAASFPATPLNPEMNFLNGESGIRPDGSSYFITNGGTVRAKDFIATAYFTLLQGSNLSSIYFTDPAMATDSLLSGGGIGCRVKGAVQ